jgi:hypothetical protein
MVSDDLLCHTERARFIQSVGERLHLLKELSKMLLYWGAYIQLVFICPSSARHSLDVDECIWALAEQFQNPEYADALD